MSIHPSLLKTIIVRLSNDVTWQPAVSLVDYIQIGGGVGERARRRRGGSFFIGRSLLRIRGVRCTLYKEHAAPIAVICRPLNILQTAVGKAR
jgi:hypothetical protein